MQPFVCAPGNTGLQRAETRGAEGEAGGGLRDVPWVNSCSCRHYQWFELDFSLCRGRVETTSRSSREGDGPLIDEDCATAGAAAALG